MIDPQGDEYLPTPEEIREAAARIREGWTEAEQRKRAGLSEELKTWTAPLIRDLRPATSKQ